MTCQRCRKNSKKENFEEGMMMLGRDGVQQEFLETY